MLATALRPANITSRPINTAAVRHDAVETGKSEAVASSAAAVDSKKNENKPRSGFFAALLRSLSAFSC